MISVRFSRRIAASKRFCQILTTCVVLALAALWPANGAHADLLVTDNTNNSVLRYSNAGIALGTFIAASGGHLPYHAPVFGPDGNIYILDYLTPDILQYNGSTGSFMSVFVSSGSGGLSNPTALTFAPDGNLYVTDDGSTQAARTVRRYNGTTGASIGTFASGYNLVVPTGIAFGPDGNMYVSDEASVAKFDGVTGAFISVFVAAGSGGLNGPDQLIFRSDGNLYVASAHSGIMIYNAQTGAFVKQLVPDFGIRSDGGLAFGPDGNIYVAYFNSASPGNDFVDGYNTQTGTLIAAVIPEGAAQGIGGIAFTSAATQVTSFIPSHGGNSGTVTIQVVGANFQPAAQLELAGNGSNIVGSPAPSANISILAATFNLQGAAPGARSLVLLNPDGTTITLNGTFTVDEGGTSQIWTQIVGYNLIRFGKQQGFFVSYGNRGNVDALAVHLILTFPSTLASALGFGNEVGVVSMANIGANTVVTVDLGRVPAAATGQLPIFLTVSSSQQAFDIQATIRSR